MSQKYHRLDQYMILNNICVTLENVFKNLIEKRLDQYCIIIPTGQWRIYEKLIWLFKHPSSATSISILL